MSYNTYDNCSYMRLMLKSWEWKEKEEYIKKLETENERLKKEVKLLKVKVYSLQTERLYKESKPITVVK